jgi:RNA polymerase sigma-70 factor (ECF subfamily)
LGSPRDWRAVTDYHRRRRARPQFSDEIPEKAAARAGEDEPDSAAREMAGCLSPLVERLDPKYEEAVRLVEIEGMSQVDAAERLHLSVSGMKARVQRARRQLKELLLACCHVELDRRGGDELHPAAEVVRLPGGLRLYRPPA